MRKMVVRMPGPSWTAKCLTSKMIPVLASMDETLVACIRMGRGDDYFILWNGVNGFWACVWREKEHRKYIK